MPVSGILFGSATPSSPSLFLFDFFLIFSLIFSLIFFVIYIFIFHLSVIHLRTLHHTGACALAQRRVLTELSAGWAARKIVSVPVRVRIGIHTVSAGGGDGELRCQIRSLAYFFSTKTGRNYDRKHWVTGQAQIRRGTHVFHPNLLFYP